MNPWEGLAASMPPDVQAALLEELRTGYQMEAVQAEINQRRAAQYNQADRRSIEGLGRHRLSIDPTSYHFWGQRLGYQCWTDPQFIREYERDNPGSRVQCKGTRTQVGYTPTSSRFRKVYAST